jgi:hypothetical protein
VVVMSARAYDSNCECALELQSRHNDGTHRPHLPMPRARCMRMTYPCHHFAGSYWLTSRTSLAGAAMAQRTATLLCNSSWLPAVLHAASVSMSCWWFSHASMRLCTCLWTAAVNITSNARTASFSAFHLPCPRSAPAAAADGAGGP